MCFYPMTAVEEKEAKAELLLDSARALAILTLGLGDAIEDCAKYLAAKYLVAAGDDYDDAQIDLECDMLFDRF